MKELFVAQLGRVFQPAILTTNITLSFSRSLPYPESSLEIKMRLQLYYEIN
jgi:hypothetical protein